MGKQWIYSYIDHISTLNSIKEKCDSIKNISIHSFFRKILGFFCNRIIITEIKPKIIIIGLKLLKLGSFVNGYNRIKKSNLDPSLSLTVIHNNKKLFTKSVSKLLSITVPLLKNSNLSGMIIFAWN